MKRKAFLCIAFSVLFCNVNCLGQEDSSLYIVKIIGCDRMVRDSAILVMDSSSSCGTLKQDDYDRIMSTQGLSDGAIIVSKNQQTIFKYNIICVCESDMDILMSEGFPCDEEGRLLIFPPKICFLDQE